MMCDCHHRAFSKRRAIYEKQIPTLEIREEEITGKYRGAPWHSRRLIATYSRQTSTKEQNQSFMGVELGHKRFDKPVNTY